MIEKSFINPPTRCDGSSERPSLPPHPLLGFGCGLRRRSLATLRSSRHFSKCDTERS